MRVSLLLLGVALSAPACSADNLSAGRDSGDTGDSGDSGDTGDAGAACGGQCATGFHCEFDTCVPDAAPPAPSSEARSPLTSQRYLFTLQADARRLVRIDSVTMSAAAFTAGLAPMDLGVVGSRELSLLLDGFDLIEVLDHRGDEVVAAAWDTARSLSHLALSPTGAHAVAYFDWDDPRAQLRQPDPGNINQVTVVALQDHPDAGRAAFADDDARAVHLAVGFLPRDVRFAADGSRAVIISKDLLTPIDLGSPFGGTVATVQPAIEFDGSATEILLDAAATLAVLRYEQSDRVDVIELAGGPPRCLQALGSVSDIDLASDGRLLVLASDGLGGAGAALSLAALADASDPCAAIGADISLENATRLAVDGRSGAVLAFRPTLAVETLWTVDLLGRTAEPVGLEKAVSGVAFAAEPGFVLVSHLRANGTPAWDPRIEDPEVSVDKSYGVTWIDLAERTHRLEVSDYAFGGFTFLPAMGGEPGATLQARLDPLTPEVLRVVHEPGFDDRRIELAAAPRDLGYLADSERAFVTQDHPWGRVTFMDVTGQDLRHVTGFALEVP